MFLSDVLAEEVARRVERGVPLQTALKAAGVTDAILSQWERIANGSVADEDGTREHIIAFTERIGQAQAECEARLVERIGEAAATVGRSGVLEWRAGAWLLNNLATYRARYHEQREMQVTSTGTLTIEQRMIAGASIEQLEAWADMELPPGGAAT